MTNKSFRYIFFFKNTLPKEILYSVALLLIILSSSIHTYGYQVSKETDTLSSEPISANWIRENLQKKGPKIVLTDRQLREIRKAVKKDPAVKAYYDYLYRNAEHILSLPALERKLEGRRLLTVSRDALSRIGILSTVFAVSDEKRFLERLDEEMVAVCNFSDWNPTHFLDVAEMAYGVAIGLDWSLHKLPPSTITLAKKALVEKALRPSLDKKYGHWIKATNNWNQVCHGGLSIAAIAVADQHPDLAAQIINRAIVNIPIALQQYGPDGVYPEGASYWAYGTSYTLLTLSTFQSAFRTDFGLGKTPGFMESALFVEMLTAPSGLYFNYFDSRTRNAWGVEKHELLAWFADKTNNRNYFNRREFIHAAENATQDKVLASRLSGAALCWISNTKDLPEQPFPENWKGKGVNPVVIFKSRKAAPSKFYLAAKGGRANLSHGNMDAGSFIFELYGVRWSVDLGLQGYTNLEQTMGLKGLWNASQESKRWTLLSKNNFGHSTLTVNDQLHRADGHAPLISFIDAATQPEGQFDLSALFPNTLAAATRRFKKLSDERLEIEDSLTITSKTEIVTWAMMTQSEAKITNQGFLLTQDGKTLRVDLAWPLKAKKIITSLDPPPLDYDMRVPNLKKITFIIEANTLKEYGGRITVHLSGGASDNRR